ncbi:glycosyltransferase [Mesosutterella sp. OilRF-GAM-744-9]|uniref:Glycosyltransferase n=1 Tax=Mesosutterella porci TaxID=2915351 RepID=A0ABS9MPV1_9BURK|nr:glycosyltransferase [Mesosutterella sp. oilRF-744-WT-GAM-9]MCG5030379.1 glycosyltransferase [Mesosutterella sp. oilRF-744-WT-GAM-9]
MKKKLAYFLICSDNIIFAAGNVALGLNKYMPHKEFDIVIYHTKLQTQNIKALEKIPRVILKEFSFDPSFQKFMLSDKGLPKNGRWTNPNSLLTAAHFEIFNLLDEYKTVIWLDCDICVQGDISELEKYGPIGQAKDLNWNTVWTVGDQFIKPVPGYDMERDSHINAVMVVNDDLPNYKDLAAYCYSLSMKWANHLKNLDQAVIQLLYQDKNIKPNEFSWNEFVCHAHHGYAPLAKMVHFGTNQKPWNNQLLLQSYPEWFRNHLEWLALGGTDFDRSNISTVGIWFDIANNYKKINEYPSLSNTSLNKNIVDTFRISIFKIIPIFTKKIEQTRIKTKILGIPFLYIKYLTPNKVFFTISLFKIIEWRKAPEERSLRIFNIPLLRIKSYAKAI